ncbi:extracellular matrix/biofilm biosynthesis regulator RemA family protein [Ruminococcus sp. NK3A76]|uniref:extracellular matrix regulator RemB n=1 Tax=Ruminococcus sp. NK3A76 TaxID=877411 RepID=UPI00048AD387|nr:extracellular matrix/biofilm biosynthesis regulator RemA family protein [Ruminococcus sp. NK3A76]
MLLHLGNEISISSKEIVGIFDIEGSSVSKITRDFLNNAEKKGKKIVYCTYDMPKSFVVTLDEDLTERIYISRISCATLLKRFKRGY